LCFQIGVVSFLIYLNTIDLISNLDGVIVFGIICALAVVHITIDQSQGIPAPLEERISSFGKDKPIRYQTAENMRAARLLNKLMVLYVCFFVAENLYYYVIMFVLHYDDVIIQEILLSIFTIIMVAEVGKVARLSY
ncbi:hypothetical protein TELCIR_20113, partial [Teladorsagia circumcincta]